MQRRIRSENIRTWMDQQGLSQVAVARRIGTTASYLCTRLTEGTAGPDLICKLLEHTDLRFDDVVER